MTYIDRCVNFIQRICQTEHILPQNTAAYFFSTIFSAVNMTDPCGHDPPICKNQGNCTRNETSSYDCNCSSGWTGPHCELGQYQSSPLFLPSTFPIPPLYPLHWELIVNPLWMVLVSPFFLFLPLPPPIPSSSISHPLLWTGSVSPLFPLPLSPIPFCELGQYPPSSLFLPLPSHFVNCVSIPPLPSSSLSHPLLWMGSVSLYLPPPSPTSICYHCWQTVTRSRTSL